MLRENNSKICLHSIRLTESLKWLKIFSIIFRLSNITEILQNELLAYTGHQQGENKQDTD